MEENRLKTGETEISETSEISGTSIHDIGKRLFEEFFKKEFGCRYRAKGLTFEEALIGTGVMRNGRLTLAGLLFFSDVPHAARRPFTVQTADESGGCLGEFGQDGTVPEIYRRTMEYFASVPAVAVEAVGEILQNALVHRDYGKNSPIRVSLFDDRVEIASPGTLPNGLSVEGILNRAPVTRNPLVAFFAKRALPYCGLGAGLRRAFKRRPGITLYNDTEGGRFVATIPRPGFDEYAAECLARDLAETKRNARLRDSYDEFIRTARRMYQENRVREPEEVDA
jgi:predicted HTH transcriptional regulator